MAMTDIGWPDDCGQSQGASIRPGNRAGRAGSRRRTGNNIFLKKVVSFVIGF